MKEKKITLKDLSKVSGYSLSSVHRAINHKEGIGEDVRKEILKIAEEMGYEVNYLASTLKKKPTRIAIVMPNPEAQGNYFRYILKGCHAMMQDVSGFNCEWLECFSELEGDSERHQLETLQLLYQEEAERLSGVVVVPVKNTFLLQAALERFIARGITVLLIDNEFKEIDRLCCISPHDFQTGRLGAEFLCGMHPRPGKILVACGDSESLSHAYNFRGFCDYIKENQLPYEVVAVEDGADTDDFTKEVKNILETEPDIVALYTVRARNTILLCNVAMECGLIGKVKLVGSDLYPESAQMLSDGVLGGIIYKNPYQKGFEGMRTIFNYLVKGEKPRVDTKTVQISVILKNNLVFFQDIYEADIDCKKQ